MMQSNSRLPSRIANYHSPKRLLLGNQAGQVPPAWRDQKQKDQGSKILLSRLPPDVGELEVEESCVLFTSLPPSQTRALNRNSFEGQSGLSKRSFSSTTLKVAQRAWPSSPFSVRGMLPSPAQSTTASTSTDVSTLSSSFLSHLHLVVQDVL